MNSYNNNFIIKTQGFAEVILDERENDCYQANHFSFNKLKEEISFLNYFVIWMHYI